MRTRVAVLLVLALVGVASADNTEDEADALFQKGRALEKEGKKTEACDLYRQARDKNPNAIGAILNVAKCDEESGKAASAYKMFKDARNRAKEQNLDPQLKAAEEHMATLEDQVAHLALAFGEEPTDDTKVLVANEVVARDKTGDVLVDPGSVAIVVSRPGRVTYQTNVAIGKGEHKAIAIPKLALPVTVRSGRRTFGKVLALSGGGLMAGSLVLGIVAWQKYKGLFHDINPATGATYCMHTPSGPQCDQDGQPQSEKWRTVGDVGSVVGYAGIAVAGLGVYLWFFGHNDEKLAFVPRIDPEQAGIVAVGHF